MFFLKQGVSTATFFILIPLYFTYLIQINQKFKCCFVFKA